MSLYFLCLRKDIMENITKLLKASQNMRAKAFKL